MSSMRGIVVLGMHRSGTSCVGRVLHAMGAYFGPPGIDLGANDENPRGFWERKDFNWVCEFALLAQGAIWHAPPLDGRIEAPAAQLLATSLARLRVELDAQSPWFLKDPRLCILLPALLPQLDDVVFVHVARDPVEIALSLERRNGLSQAHALALWELHTLAAFDATRGRRRLLIDYTRLLDQPQACVAELAEFLQASGFASMRALDAAACAACVEPDLRRAVRSAELARYLNPEQIDLQRALDSGALADEHRARALSEGARAELEYQARQRLTPDMKSTQTKPAAAVRARFAEALVGRGLDDLRQARR